MARRGKALALGPLFILGFPRSGTTAMANAIARLKRFGGYGPEGHFIYLFAGPLNRIAAGEFNANSILHEEGAPDTVLDAFRALTNQLYSSQADPADTTWIDKTPDLLQVRAVPLIDRLWPDARYIFLYRPPEAAVRSSLALWPGQVTGNERNTAQRWVNCQQSWRRVRPRLGTRCVDVFQPEMLAAPQTIAAALQPLLDLSDSEVDALTRIWTRHPRMNRPDGPRGEAYDKVTLTAEVAADVTAITREEAAHWPAITAADAKKSPPR
ncbi:sulfotransferase [Acuticoccus sp. MNP-M23]|uniref:sulfotransferase family protein n=1 Tax=Acuticoccus sp. MNP-M23 TaxID=3072793 RepID=UPI00281508D3|nr:sulfotransferase [Acuticoccus sp. MNP-M23]WMS43097.1 sulfotransferase [Acuticoccus sp. MNP-M23]